MLDSPAYRTALANQTEWSKTNICAFQEHDPAVARITISRGQGRGAALGIVRLRPAAGSQDRLRATLREKLDPDKLDGIISMHLIESDPALSKPLTDDPPASNPGAGDWFILIDATDVNALPAAMAARFTGSGMLEGGIKISSGSYRLMWDLARSDVLLS